MEESDGGLDLKIGQILLIQGFEPQIIVEIGRETNHRPALSGDMLRGRFPLPRPVPSGGATNRVELGLDKD